MIESNKLMNLADGKVLYDDLRDRVEKVLEDIAPDYSELTFPVAKDTPCVHEGVIYRAGQDIQNSETWTAAHWVAVANVMGEIGALLSAINSVEGSIAPVETTATATAAHAVGELFMMGETLLVALSAIAVGDTITTEGATPNAAVTTLSAKLIKDVQVNGTSVLNNGVANVPVASGSSIGAIKVNVGTYGLQMVSGGSGASDKIAIYKASSLDVKNGANGSYKDFRPIVPSIQHESVFYALAKLAGADMASLSGETVGVYPEAQKVAIQKMLGVYREWELIGDYTLSEDSEQYDLTTDSNGDSFELSEIYVRCELPPPTTGTQDYVTAIVLTNKLDGGTGTGSAPTFRYNSATAKLCPVYRSEIICGVVEAWGRQGAAFLSTQSVQGISSSSAIHESIRGFRLARYSATQTLIPSGTKVTIYGKRK